MDIPRQKVELVHASGTRFSVFLTEYEINRAHTDDKFANELVEKYHNLYQNGIIFSETNEITISDPPEPEYPLSDELSEDAMASAYTEDSLEYLENPSIQNAVADEIEGDNLPNCIQIWTKRGRETEDDQKATKYLLLLRGCERYRKKFDDKKTTKLTLWCQLADEMNKAGFFIGEGKLGAKRCRQKFSNLYKSYVSFLKHVHTTGVERKEPPDYYEGMHNILGGKDKIFPQYTFDSIEGFSGPSELKGNSLENMINTPSTSDNKNKNKSRTIITQKEENVILNSTPKTSKTENIPLTLPSTSKESKNTNEKRSRFENVRKTLKPNINYDIITTIKDMHTENETSQQNQFNKIVDLITVQNELLKEQNSQRSRMIDILQYSFKEKKGKSQKRKLYESSDSEN